MTDVKPRKTLSLKRKVKPASTDADQKLTGKADQTATTGDEVKEFVRGRKRVIKMQTMAQKKAIKDSNLSPSERQSRELKRILAETFSVWRRRRPLAIGVDEQIAEFLVAENLEISKRAIKKLLHRHTNHRNYLQNVMRGGARFKLDGTEVGEVQKEEKEHAKRALEALDNA
ncbi:MAG: ProQ/FINO family protein [Leucothrix sp.]